MSNNSCGLFTRLNFHTNRIQLLRQVTMQLKILTTAVFSVLILGRALGFEKVRAVIRFLLRLSRALAACRIFSVHVGLALPIFLFLAIFASDLLHPSLPLSAVGRAGCAHNWLCAGQPRQRRCEHQRHISNTTVLKIPVVGHGSAAPLPRPARIGARCFVDSAAQSGCAHERFRQSLPTAVPSGSCGVWFGRIGASVAPGAAALCARTPAGPPRTWAAAPSPRLGTHLLGRLFPGACLLSLSLADSDAVGAAPRRYAREALARLAGPGRTTRPWACECRRRLPASRPGPARSAGR